MNVCVISLMIALFARSMILNLQNVQKSLILSSKENIVLYLVIFLHKIVSELLYIFSICVLYKILEYLIVIQ